jgi:hypothetical protein
MTIKETLFTRNTATGGDGVDRGITAALSASGNGGALANQSGDLEIQNSAFTFNQANGGPVTYVPPWGAGGGTGSGGGIYSSSSGALVLINCTLAANGANGGAGGHDDFNGQAPGGSAYGGALFVGGGRASVANLTFGTNSVEPGVLGSPEALGASISNVKATITLTNTVLACASSQTNVSGAIMDGGHNISSDASAAFTLPTSRDNTDPMLGPLADNGGPTPTMALLPGSPARDAGDDSVCPATDQRGIRRPQGAACDIGAFEAVPQ